MIDENLTNKKLIALFGAQDNIANFRLAFTEGQYEHRKNLLGEIEYLPRYTYLPRGYWAIERLTKIDGVNAEMLPGIKHSYEPIYIFRNPRNNEPIPVVEDIVIALIHACLFAQESKVKRDWKQEELSFYEKQVERAYEFISDECSPMSMKLHLGEAVVKGERKDN